MCFFCISESQLSSFRRLKRKLQMLRLDFSIYNSLWLKGHTNLATFLWTHPFHVCVFHITAIFLTGWWICLNSALLYLLKICTTGVDGIPTSGASHWQCNGLWQGWVDNMPFPQSLAMSRILIRISKAFSSAPTVPHHLLTTISLYSRE